MLKRVTFKMPSCTNQLESTHGHLNALIPRRNSFWKSIKRLADAIISKNHKFELYFKQNYSRHKTKIKNIVKSTPVEIMHSMIKHYQTNLISQSCKCGESCLLSSMLRAKIPCSHLFFLGMPFPVIKPPKIELENKFQGEIFYEYKIFDSQKVQTNFDYYVRIRKIVVENIRKFTHYSEKKEIIEHVEKKLPFIKTPEVFVLNKPIEAITTIDEGILIFSQKKEEMTKQKEGLNGIQKKKGKLKNILS